jgi:hypothetical protein
MGVISSLKAGANLGSPKLSVGWIIGGIVAAFLLIGVFLVATKAMGTAQSIVPQSSAVMAPARVYIS